VEANGPTEQLSAEGGFPMQGHGCEAGKDSERLTPTHDSLSPAPSRRCKYQTDIENPGRAVVVAIRLTDESQTTLRDTVSDSITGNGGPAARAVNLEEHAAGSMSD
jgi:hypothetical protein